MTQEFIIDNSDKLDINKNVKRLIDSRENYYKAYKKYDFMATIYIYAFNRIEKTKKCIESILKYTLDVSYELILIDNGSSDGTYEYFKALEYPDKTVVKVKKNTGIGIANEIIMYAKRGKYLVHLGNDMIVTPNWLSNLIKCMESDNSIGMAVPMMSNCSNLQEPDFTFSSYEDMQEKAKEFNVSDPLKWEERMRLVTPMNISRPEATDVVGLSDRGFLHDFAEDDWCIRIRRAGYKLILCGDTFVHHDHDFRRLEDKRQEEFEESLESGRKNYEEKYHGIDAWDDILNFERNLINMLPIRLNNYTPNILGIDVKCGTPILEIKNKLKKNGIIPNEVSSFITNAKYYEDLLTVSQKVFCDRTEYFTDYFGFDTIDITILGEPINNYYNPVRFLQKILEVTKPGGIILFKLKNVFDINSLFISLGNKYTTDGEMPISISLQDVVNCLNMMKVKDIKITAESYEIDENTKGRIEDIINKSAISNDVSGAARKTMAKGFLLCVEK